MKDGFIYAFENFVYVPIVSAVIGAAFSLIIPKLGIKIWERVKKRINRKVDIIDISGNWNSFFHEGDIIQSETINLAQEGQVIRGEIILDKRKYILQGEFKNQILIATYISNNRKKDERGAVILRRINENLLSGFCTFVYKDKQVYSSPYVLTSQMHMMLKRELIVFAIAVLVNLIVAVIVIKLIHRLFCHQKHKKLKLFQGDQ